MIKNILISFGILLIAGCATVAAYELQVRSACSQAVADTESPLGLLAQTVPPVAVAVGLVEASCKTEAALATLIISPTAVAWVNTLITTIRSGGKVVPPAPIETP